LLGYRKYGHNEGDEPRFTQPKLYKAIATHNNARDIYAERLIKEGVIDKDFVSQLEEEYKNHLEEKLEISRQQEKTTVTPFMKDEWEGFEYANQGIMRKDADTSFDLKKLGGVAKVITKLPKNKKFLRKIERLIEARETMYFKDNKLDWAMGELLA